MENQKKEGITQKQYKIKEDYRNALIDYKEASKRLLEVLKHDFVTGEGKTIDLDAIKRAAYLEKGGKCLD